MIKAVLFDLDDTLYDVMIPHKKALKEVHDCIKSHIKYNHFLDAYEKAKKQALFPHVKKGKLPHHFLYFKRAFENEGIHIKLLLKLEHTYWRVFLKHMKIREGIPLLLRTLKKEGIKVGIVTNHHTSIQYKKLVSLGISSFIDVIVTSEEVGYHKPHEQPFKEVLKRLKLKPIEVIMVGDHIEEDIEGANASGIPSVWYYCNNDVLPKKKIQQPDFIIEHFSQLLRIIEHYNKMPLTKKQNDPAIMKYKNLAVKKVAKKTTKKAAATKAKKVAKKTIKKSTKKYPLRKNRGRGKND